MQEGQGRAGQGVSWEWADRGTAWQVRSAHQFAPQHVQPPGPTLPPCWLDYCASKSPASTAAAPVQTWLTWRGGMLRMWQT